MIKREYLTTTEAAELVGVTRQRIEALVRRGTLGDYRAYGRRVVCKGELYQWAKTRPAVKCRRRGGAGLTMDRGRGGEGARGGDRPRGADVAGPLAQRDRRRGREGAG